MPQAISPSRPEVPPRSRSARGLAIAACTSLLVLAASTTLPAQAQRLLDGRSGGSEVGFTVRWFEPDSGGRPIRLLAWYPADGGGTAMDFGDYLETANRAGSGEWSDHLRARELATARRQFFPPSDSLWQVLARMPVGARRDATPSRGRHPVVLHLLGLGDWSLESTVLWERLASEGHVVAVLSQLPDSPTGAFRFGTPMLTLHLSDARRAMALLHHLPASNPEKVTVIGHSSGGLVALLLAASDSTIDGVVTLDGSAGTRDGVAVLDSLGWDPAGLAVPVLDLYRAANSTRDLSRVDPISRTWRTAVSIGGDRPPMIATHFDFQNWPLYAGSTGFPDPRGEPARPTERGIEIYMGVVELVSRWLGNTANPQAAIDTWLLSRPVEAIPVGVSHALAP